MTEPVGCWDDLPAVNFGNLPPLPVGYAVVWFVGDEFYHATKRGTDLEIYDSWNRFSCRRACFAHAAKQ